jgi:preprotein translocase subunit SecY
MSPLLLVFRIPELRKKIFFILLMLVLFRFAAAIPMPGVDLARLEAFFASNQLLGLVSVFTGGTLANFSVVLLGLGPYITAVIIMQLLTMIFPNLRELYLESGPEGRQKFNQFGRYLTVPMAAFQTFGTLTLLRSQGIVGAMSTFDLVSTIITVTAGAVFLMWLGELITERGLGNGISLLIFAGIIAGLPPAVAQAVVAFDQAQLFTYLAFLAVAVLVIIGVVIVSEGTRNIPVSFARRVRGRRMFGGFASHIPMRVNQAGVMPIIFALSILLFPGLIAQFLANVNIPWIANSASTVAAFFQNSLAYGVFYFIFVVIFTYFYTAVTFDPKVISENIQKQGGFIPGIRPGPSTAGFLSHVVNRITLVGALFLGAIAVLPLIVQAALGVQTLTIGGTALLIVVSVAIETMRQIEAQLTAREYEGF